MSQQQLRTRSWWSGPEIYLVVDDYDEAIDFFVNALGFELVEDSPSLTNDGRPKRWVVVRPSAAGDVGDVGGTALLLARADGEMHPAAGFREGPDCRVDDAVIIVAGADEIRGLLQMVGCVGGCHHDGCRPHPGRGALPGR